MQWVRQAAQRISLGSSRLAAHLGARAVHRARGVWRRVSGWLSAGQGLGWALRLAVLLGAAAVLRKIVTGAGGGMYEAVADGRAPWLLWGAAIGWVIGAYRVGHPDWKPKPLPSDEPADAEPETDEEQPAAEQTPTGPPPVSPVALIAAVRDVGTPHAQLKPLAEHLGTTTDVVRAAAAGVGWPVKDVRMAGRSASAGLRWDEAPALPPLGPVSGVVGAGQGADDNDDDSGGEGPGEGVQVRRTDGGLIIYDLADTVRHQKVRGAK
jgi:hypothetical protein